MELLQKCRDVGRRNHAVLCSKSPTSIGTRGSDETVDRREMARIRGVA